jgi:hypothetical protein
MEEDEEIILEAPRLRRKHILNRKAAKMLSTLEKIEEEENESYSDEESIIEFCSERLYEKSCDSNIDSGLLPQFEISPIINFSEES